MKKFLSVSTIVAVNLTLLFGIFANLLIYGRSWSDFTSLQLEHFFKPDPVANITLVSSFICLLLYNFNRLLRRNK